MEKMNLLSERLGWAVSEKQKTFPTKITNVLLAEKAGVDRAAVTHWFKDANGIGRDQSEPLAEFLGCNEPWLRKNEGSPTGNKKLIKTNPIDDLLRSDANAGLESVLLKCFRGSTQEDRELLLQIANRFYSIKNPDDKTADPFRHKRKASQK